MESCPDRHIPTSKMLTLATEELGPHSHVQAHMGPWVNNKLQPSLPPFLPTPLFHLTQLGHPWPGKLPWLLPLEQALAATLCSSPTIAWGGQAVEKASPLVLKYATKICMVLV